MYIGDKLVDQVLLSPQAMQDDALREAYVQGAIKDLLEKWEDLIEELGQQPQFYIRVNNSSWMPLKSWEVPGRAGLTADEQPFLLRPRMVLIRERLSSQDLKTFCVTHGPVHKAIQEDL